MNKERCEQVLAWIESNPEHWDQKVWHCGTSHCFAGVAEMMRLGQDPSSPVPDEYCNGNFVDPGFLLSYSETAKWLGFEYQINDAFTSWEQLVSESNTLDDLRRIIRGDAA